MTIAQRATLIASAKSWLVIGQRVKGHLDPRVGGGDVACGFQFKAAMYSDLIPSTLPI